MRFFFCFFAAATLLTGIFTITDSAGSGAGWACIIFAALGIGVGAYNWYANGSPLAEGRAIPPTDPNAPK